MTVHRSPHTDERGVAIIFMVAIIAALAIMSTCFVIVARQESSAAKSTLAATQGTTVHIRAEGQDEDEAIEAMIKLFGDRFGEDE